MAGVSGVGLSWSSKISLCPAPKPSPASRRVSSVVKMAVSVEKKPFSLQKSEEIFTAAKELMPGGVNSPVRAFKSVGGQPIVFDSVKGSRMWDVDGNEYIDYVGSWGPAIIGHADDKAWLLIIEQIGFCDGGALDESLCEVINSDETACSGISELEINLHFSSVAEVRSSVKAKSVISWRNGKPLYC